MTLDETIDYYLTRAKHPSKHQEHYLQLARWLSKFRYYQRILNMVCDLVIFSKKDNTYHFMKEELDKYDDIQYGKQENGNK